MAASSSAARKPAVGILSIGDMGMGMAKLLRAYDYPVFTVASGRSQHTKDRIKAAKITDVPSDEALVIECDIILSIVPPRDAIAIAKRVHASCVAAAKEREDNKGNRSLLFVDLNAISPRTTKIVGSIVACHEEGEKPAPTQQQEDDSAPTMMRRISRTLSMKSEQPAHAKIPVDFLDGGIIGGPPQLLPDKKWKKPSVVISGPKQYLFTEDLQQILNVKHISEEIGSASTLKACFASLNKGLVALGIASYTTALTAGVLPELQSHMQEFYPQMQERIEKGLTTMPPKAYRWVDEMKQIGETFAGQGHLGQGHGGQAMFEGVSEIYKTVAEDTALGKELVHKRKRGTTAQDVAEAIKEGLEAKRNKGEKDPKLDLAWRGSWS